MNKVLGVGVCVVGLVVGACGGSKPAAVVPSNSSTSTTTWTTRPVTAAPGYCDVYATWNKAVDEWNKLTNERDAAHLPNVVVNGVSYPTYEDWAKANGKPVQMVQDNCGQQ